MSESLWKRLERLERERRERLEQQRADAESQSFNDWGLWLAGDPEAQLMQQEYDEIEAGFDLKRHSWASEYLSNKRAVQLQLDLLDRYGDWVIERLYGPDGSDT